MRVPKRILLAKMGLDSHDTGIITVASILRDAGHEVIYLGLHNQAKGLVRAAIDESADAIGISFLSGQHMTQMRRLIDEMQSQQLSIPVFCGGVIPDEDAAALRQMGVTEVIMPGTLSVDVARLVNNALTGLEA
ncbi:MAG: cobalamin-dependent protein [Burkholderiaceae bacterium]|nr:cobalamin-dependent protein [Burkholderiaceae bacterium]